MLAVTLTASEPAIGLLEAAAPRVMMLYRGAFLSGETSGESAWNPVIWPFRLVFFLGFLALALQGTAELIRAFYALRGRPLSEPSR